MSRRGGTRIRAEKKPVVVLAGEDRNDRQSLRVVLEATCPDMRGRLVEINDTVRLRHATGANLHGRVESLAKKVRARALREDAEVACVFVHEDMDDVESVAAQQVFDRVQGVLESVFGSAHYVLAVAEIEAWLLRFPEALNDLVSSWKVPARYLGKDTGRFADPKRILMREISKSSRRYRESDAPRILERAVALGCLHKPTGQSRSWDRFQSDIERCCAHHLRLGRLRSRR